MGVGLSSENGAAAIWSRMIAPQGGSGSASQGTGCISM